MYNRKDAFYETTFNIEYVFVITTPSPSDENKLQKYYHGKYVTMVTDIDFD